MWLWFLRRRRTTPFSWSFLRYDRRKMWRNWMIAFAVLALIKLWFLIPLYVVLYFVSHLIAYKLKRGPYETR